jgi:DNA repair protein RecO (recombination protein O)
MAIQKTEALVLKSIKLGETSKILTLLTRDYGLEKVVAKGSRSTKSRYWGTLEPLNHIQIVYYAKSNRDLQLLSQAEIINSFPSIREDLNKMAYALAICEMISRTQMPSDINPVLFQLLVDSLCAINATNHQPQTSFLGFQVKFLNLAGVHPNLDKCLKCKRSLTNEPVLFEPHSGGIICEICSVHQVGQALSAKGLRFLNWLSLQDCQEISRHAIPDVILQEVEKILETYIRFHIEGLEKINAIRFLTKI